MINIRHIFFDLDNTLWDFPKNSREVITDLFHEYNLESRCNVTASDFIAKYEHINEVLWEKLRKQEITKEQLRSSRFYNSMQHFGHDDYELGYRMEEEYVKRSPYKKNLMKGTLETLEKLSTRYQLHIITNGFKEVQYTKLENCGLKSYFNHIIISEEVGYSKPNSKIFEVAIERANAKPAESLMVGDDLEIDINGARAAGMQAIHFTTQIPTETSSSNESINALPELLQRLSF